MQLPNAQRAIVAKEKIVEYLLNPLHPDGASKARFFAGFGFAPDDWEKLAESLKELAIHQPAAGLVESIHGRKYIIEGTLESPNGRTGAIRTVWIIDAGMDMPRFVTAYPRNED